MKALMTGASGFLGRHLAAFLQEQQVEVFSLGVNPLPGRHFNMSTITDAHTVQRALIEVRPDFFFHLAGTSHTKTLSQMYAVNCSFAATIFDQLLSSGPQVPILLAGSAAEYGQPDNPDVALSESHPARPVSHYGISKYSQTLMALGCVGHYAPIIVARPFNIIGTGMNPRLAIPEFLSQLLLIANGNQEAVLHVGDLDTYRDFLDVRDFVEICWRLIRCREAYGKILNICSGKATALGDICRTLIEVSGMQVKIAVDDRRIDKKQPRKIFGDDSATRSAIGYTASISIEDSLNWIAESSSLKCEHSV